MNEVLAHAAQQRIAQINAEAAAALKAIQERGPQTTHARAFISFDASLEVIRLDYWHLLGGWQVQKYTLPKTNPYTKNPWKPVAMEAEIIPGFSFEAELKSLHSAGWDVIHCSGFIRAWKWGKSPVRPADKIKTRRATVERNLPRGLSLVEVRNLDLAFYL